MSKRKRSAGFTTIPVKAEISLGNLGDNTVITGALLGSLGRGLYAISADLTFAMRDHTSNEGPLNFGISHGDYTVAEIGEALTSWVDPDDKVASERARRQIRRVGTFHGQGTHEVWNDGKTKRVKIKMALGEGQDLDVFVLNDSGAALTTGTVVQIYGVLYGKWDL